MNPRQQAFLEAYALCGNVARAAILAKVCRRSHYVWLRKPDYAEAFKEAHEDYCDALRSEIWKRAVGGVAEPVIYQGRLQFEPLRTKTGRIRVDKHGRPLLSNVPLVIYRKSDTLLMFEAKKHMPEYRDSFVPKHNAGNTHRLQGSLADLASVPMDPTVRARQPSTEAACGSFANPKEVRLRKLRTTATALRRYS